MERASAKHWRREAGQRSRTKPKTSRCCPNTSVRTKPSDSSGAPTCWSFFSDHLEPLEHYRLSESDLAFGELLPPKPGWLEQDEDEERTRVGFGLERVARRICSHPEIIEITNPYARPANTDGQSE